MAQIAEVIKYEGDNSTFIWKHPSEDFNSLTQLIVHESQEAIFFMNGQALDLFGAGRYTLETENIPQIGRLLKRTTGDQTPFHCEVYFINKSIQMALKWGTDSKVRYIDPSSGVPLELGASGSMNMQVSDSRKLLIKLVGTMKGIAWENEGSEFTKSIQNSFRPVISTAVKTTLSTVIKALNINILEVDEHLNEVGKELHQKILPEFEEYGITIPQFYLTTVVLPEDDPNFKKIRELYSISLQQRMIEAERDIRTTKAQAEAEVTAAARAAEMERQTTQDRGGKAAGGENGNRSSGGGNGEKSRRIRRGGGHESPGLQPKRCDPSRGSKGLCRGNRQHGRRRKCRRLCHERYRRTWNRTESSGAFRRSDGGFVWKPRLGRKHGYGGDSGYGKLCKMWSNCSGRQQILPGVRLKNRKRAKGRNHLSFLRSKSRKG